MDDLGIRFANLGNQTYIRVNDVKCVFPFVNKTIRQMYTDACDMGTCLKLTTGSKVNCILLLTDGRMIAVSSNPMTVMQRLNEAIICPANALPVRSSYVKKMDDMNMMDDDDDDIDDDSVNTEIYMEPVDPAADLDDNEVPLPKRRGRKKHDPEKAYELRDSIVVVD